MKAIAVFGLLLFMSTFGSAQKIDVIQEKGRIILLQEDRPLRMRDLMEILESYEGSANQLQGVKLQREFSIFLEVAGGGFIGYPIGTWIYGGDFNWYLAGAGGLALAMSIPLSKSGNKKMIKAADIFNEQFDDSTYFQAQPRNELRLQSTSAGLSLVYIY